MGRDTRPTVKLYSDRNLRQLKAVRLKFLRNSRGFLSAYRFPIIALAAAAALDCISTMHFMLYERDHMSELHPVFFWAAAWFGPVCGPIAGKSAQIAFGLIATVYVRPYALLLLWATTVLYSYAFLHNLYVTDVFTVWARTSWG